MIPREEFFKNGWRWIAGYQERYNDTDMPTHNELERSEWCIQMAEAMRADFERFLKLMKARMVQGAFRYGLIGEQYRDRDYDPTGGIKACVKRLEYVQESQDTEGFVDVANFCLFMFYQLRNQKGWHFGQTDPDKVEIKQ